MNFVGTPKFRRTFGVPLNYRRTLEVPAKKKKKKKQRQISMHIGFPYLVNHTWTPVKANIFDGW
jgi:hypothetical protein